jgi:hypothetical protein
MVMAVLRLLIRGSLVRAQEEEQQKALVRNSRCFFYSVRLVAYFSSFELERQARS